MRVHVNTELAAGSAIELQGEEHHYLSHVRRVRPGDHVKIRDANDVVYEAQVVSVGKNATSLVVESQVAVVAREWPVEVVCTVPRRNVMDDLVRQLGELGVQRLWPVTAARSVAKPSDAKLERWRRIAEESTRQCGRVKPMEISDLAPLGEAVQQIDTEGRFVAHSASEVPLLGSQIAKLEREPESIALALGPEGGFTETEVSLLSEGGWLPISLGLSILRVETAAIVGATLAVALLGGFGPFEVK